MQRFQILLYYSWIATLLALIFLYGGFHPDGVAANFIKYYTKTLVLFMNFPVLIIAIRQMFKRESGARYLIIIVLSLTLQIYLLR